MALERLKAKAADLWWEGFDRRGEVLTPDRIRQNLGELTRSVNIDMALAASFLVLSLGLSFAQGPAEVFPDLWLRITLATVAAGGISVSRMSALTSRVDELESISVAFEVLKRRFGIEISEYILGGEDSELWQCQSRVQRNLLEAKNGRDPSFFNQRKLHLPFIAGALSLVPTMAILERQGNAGASLGERVRKVISGFDNGFKESAEEFSADLADESRRNIAIAFLKEQTSFRQGLCWAAACLGVDFKEEERGLPMATR